MHHLLQHLALHLRPADDVAEGAARARRRRRHRRAGNLAQLAALHVLETGAPGAKHQLVGVHGRLVARRQKEHLARVAVVGQSRQVVEQSRHAGHLVHLWRRLLSALLLLMLHDRLRQAGHLCAPVRASGWTHEYASERRAKRSEEERRERGKGSSRPERLSSTSAPRRLSLHRVICKHFFTQIYLFLPAAKR